MTPLLDYISVEHNPTNQTIDKAVIWLHGLGASGHDFEPIVPELKLPDDLGVRFIFPHAPKIPVTINGGYVMPAWYDILEMTLERKVDVAQIVHATNHIHALVEEQIQKGVPSQNIVIAGFSQGGAVAYHAVLTSPKKLAGLLALSTYFATATHIESPQASKSLPISISHGNYDEVVPVSLGKSANDTLMHMGYAPQFKTYPMAHHVCQAQIKDIGRWLTQVFSGQSSI